MPNREAVRVQPNADGFCPILKPGEYCRDAIDNVYHFCAPDESRFSVDNGSDSKDAAKVKETKDGITFVKGMPPHWCCRRGKRLENRWSIHNGIWIELPNE